MRLNYFMGKNFGDALNPIIFNKLLPNFFNDDSSVDFFGIGSIIGFDMVKEARRLGIDFAEEAKQKIIFSSGFTSAYATLPEINHSYDIVCVRGPLTANALKIKNNLAVTDGAALLREFNFPTPKKQYKVSFMPHWESEMKYPWEKLCQEAGVHYVSPTTEPMQVIEDILKSEMVIAEAMHFAIVADTLRVPWIPVKAYQTIDNFKWNDWTLSLSMVYDTTMLKPLFNNHNYISHSFRKKVNNKLKLPHAVFDIFAKGYMSYQESFLRSATVNQFKNFAKAKSYLSKDSVFNEKVDTLLEKLEMVKHKYEKINL